MFAACADSHQAFFYLRCSSNVLFKYMWCLLQDVGYQASYSQPSDFGQYGVKNMVTTMPGGEQDALVGNRSISKVLEDVPRYTGRLKSNIAEIRPQVCVDDMDRELQYQIKSSTEVSLRC